MIDKPIIIRCDTTICNKGNTEHPKFRRVTVLVKNIRDTLLLYSET